MDLTPFLRFGQENIVAVRLDTEKWESRWYPGAGIYRHVWMVKTGGVHVAHWGTRITSPEISGESALINMGVTVENQENASVEAVVETSIFEFDANNQIGSEVVSLKQQTIQN
ncbi:MAG: hypothetical protein AB2L20_03735 [Mangrovibacterium sp.]